MKRIPLSFLPTMLSLVLIVVGGRPVRAQAPGQPPNPTALTIVEAARLGVERHPRIAAALARLEAARAGEHVTTSARLPSLTVEASATGFQEPMIVAPLHGFDPTTPPVFARTLFQSRWLAAYTLFDGGRRAALIAQSRAAASVEESSAEAADLDVIEAVTTAYLSVLTARAILEAENRRLSALQQERNRVVQVFEVGRTARVELLRADAAVANAEASQVASREDLAASLNSLARLLGMDRESLDTRQFEPAHIAGEDPLSGDPLGRALQHNASLAAAGHNVDVNEATAREARSAWLPAVRFNAGVVTFAGSGANLTGEWQAGVSVSYPVFTGGMRAARISQASAAARAAEAIRQELILQISIAVERTVSNIRASRARTASLARAVEYAEEVARIERLALGAGAGVQTDLLRAESELFRVQADLERARHAEIAASISLAKITGDLSLAWLDEHVENAR